MLRDALTAIRYVRNSSTTQDGAKRPLGVSQSGLNIANFVSGRRVQG